MGVIHLVTEAESIKCAQGQFWSAMNVLLFSNKLQLHTAGGITNVDTVCSNLNLAQDDVLIIIVDYPEDNPAAVGAVSSVYKKFGNLPNVYVLTEICFESTLLTFKSLDSWLYSTEYRKTEQYQKSLHLRLLRAYNGTLQDWKNSSIILNVFLRDTLGLKVKRFQLDDKITFKYEIPPLQSGSKVRYRNLTVETVASFILDYLTKEQCRFHVTKKKMGDCWLCNCTDANICPRLLLNLPVERLKPGLQCGILEDDYTAEQKARLILKGTSVYTKLTEAKRKFLSNGYSIAKYIP